MAGEKEGGTIAIDPALARVASAGAAKSGGNARYSELHRPF